MDTGISLTEDLDDLLKSRCGSSDTTSEGLDDIFNSIYSHPKVASFLSGIDIQFKNKKLFVEAVTHTSFVNEQTKHSFHSFERLEFFGDSLFNLFVSDFLMEKFPSLNEGPLSRFRGAVVNEGSKAELARAFL